MGKILSVKVQNNKGNECEFKSKINLGDFNQLALLFNDLECFGANIEKAVSKFKRDKVSFPWN
jgi:hypothetical protein